jgi:hypothetical protein
MIPNALPLHRGVPPPSYDAGDDYRYLCREIRSLQPILIGLIFGDPGFILGVAMEMSGGVGEDGFLRFEGRHKANLFAFVAILAPFALPGN